MSGWVCGCGHQLPLPVGSLHTMRCSVCDWRCDAGGRVTPANPPSPQQSPEPVAAPVEGFRVWRVHRDDYVTLTRALVQQLYDNHEAGRNPFTALLPGARLHPVASATGAWERVHTAVCTLGISGALSASSWAGMMTAHEAPQRGCHCGLWALKDEQEAHHVAADYQLTSGYAVGKLRLWGRVVEHARGYRGQHAQPVSLTYVGDGPEAEEVAGELAAFYGCPCILQAPSAPTLAELRFPPASAYAAQLASWNISNSGMAAQLAVGAGGYITASVTASNAAFLPVEPKRRAWPVRFARWTSYTSNGLLGFACYLALVFAIGVPGAALLGNWGALLCLPWIALWAYANLSR